MKAVSSEVPINTSQRFSSNDIALLAETRNASKVNEVSTQSTNLSTFTRLSKSIVKMVSFSFFICHCPPCDLILNQVRHIPERENLKSGQESLLILITEGILTIFKSTTPFYRTPESPFDICPFNL